MTKEAALYNFWSSFTIPAYEENTVYAMAEQGSAPTFPYITYEVRTDSLYGDAIPLTASIWYRSSSWIEANAKKQEISEFIGYGGCTAAIDDGAIWIKRGSPFAQNTGDDSDDMIKRVILNISVEFWTEN